MMRSDRSTSRTGPRGTSRWVIGATLTGALAGALGTLAMDLVWYRRYRRSGGAQAFREWESADGVADWDSASAPGQVGRKALRIATGGEPPDAWARAATNVVHWGTGIAWGVQYAAARSLAPGSRVLPFLLGPAAWATGYIILPLIGVYRPIWTYDAKTLGQDLSAHVVYGAVTAATLGGLRRISGSV